MTAERAKQLRDLLDRLFEEGPSSSAFCEMADLFREALDAIDELHRDAAILRASAAPHARAPNIDCAGFNEGHAQVKQFEAECADLGLEIRSAGALTGSGGGRDDDSLGSRDDREGVTDRRRL